MTNFLTQLQATTYLAASPNQNNWLWLWLDKFLGDDGATAVFSTISVLINLVVGYIMIMAGIRLVKAVQEKNSEDPKERADAVVTMKGAIITIVLAGLIGLVGFNVFVTFVGVWWPQS